MVKRLLTVPLVIIFTIAVFSFPIFATIPDNITDLPYSVVFRYKYQGVPKSFSFDQVSGSCQYYSINYSPSVDSGSVYDQSINISVDSNTTVSFYVALRDSTFSSSSFVISDSLLPFYTPSGNLSDNFSVPASEISINPVSNNFVITAGSSIIKGVEFLYFSNVPSGSYFVSDTRDAVSFVCGFYVSDIFSSPLPDPDPPVSDSSLLSDLGSVVTASLVWVSDSVDTIVSHPFLLLVSGFLCIGAAISFLGRLLSRS